MIKQNQILENFDLSIIMPFYKRLDDFKIILPRNVCFFQRNGIEVIIVMDEATEKEALIEFLKQYPFINWRVITNYKPHEFRNPAKAINIGIRHAKKKYIMVCSPETEFYTDVIFQLRVMLEYYPNCYATGYVAFIDFKTNVTNEIIKTLFLINYGSFMAERNHIEKIGGYDESYIKWGGEDDNIRSRLEMEGIRKLKVYEAIALHREKVLKLHERGKRTKDMPGSDYAKSIIPLCSISNMESEWGKDFNNIVFDWQNNEYNEVMCCNYLKEFIQYELKNKNVFSLKYNRVIICQSYNEIEMLEGFFENMSLNFDGIILLDDESSDGTYECACHEKLLLKVQKKRLCFNDLENRNILLNLASFFRSQWYCFMDFDERFDSRFSDFSFTDKTNHDVIFFRLVHLWDNEKYYNAEYPYSFNGVQLAMRMFRNIGRVQIHSETGKLHFPAIPYRSRLFYSNILFLHYGHISKEKRIKKYNFYIQEDIDHSQMSYEHFLADPLVLPLRTLH